MKAVTFCFENLEPTPYIYRFVLAFLPFIVDATYGKILNRYMRRVAVGKQLARNINSLAQAKNITYLEMPR